MLLILIVTSTVLCVTVVDRGVTYTSTEICAFRGSTVEMSCTYRYPSRVNSINTKVNKRFWFTKLNPTGSAVDLDTDSNYNGRLEHVCNENICSLRIRHLRTTDSAQYKFRFETNQYGGSYIGSPGVTLSVADHQLQVNVRRSTVSQSNWTELTCHSSCPDGHFSYIWYKNRHKVEGEKNKYFLLHLSGSADSYQCAIVGNEDFYSPQVYAPKLLSVSLSPSGDIKEGDTVTLTCSSDANPAASYTWYKENEDSPKASGHIFTITDVRLEHSGNYSCEAQNTLGHYTSTLHLVVVAGAVKSVIAAALSSVVLVIILISVLLWIIKKRVFKQRSEPGQRPDNRDQCLQIQPAEQQDDVHYASVHFSNSDSLYSNVRPAQTRRHKEEKEEDKELVEYAAVTFKSTGAAQRTRRQEAAEDPAALYSTVNKH